MDGATTLLSTSSHFPIASKDFLPQAYHTPHGTPSTASSRKRKPVVTYQSPGSGVVDVGLLVRNTKLEIEAAAAAAARAVPSKALKPTLAALAPTASAVAASTGPPVVVVENAAMNNTSTTATVEPTPQPPRGGVVQRPYAIPRPPRPLYHPLSRPSSSKPAIKARPATSSGISQLAPPATEPGRRSSSRTRRPAPKMRETESLVSVTKIVSDKTSPKRRRGPVGKRKRGMVQLDVDGDGAYPSTKRIRKPRERIEVDVESETMPPPPNEATPLVGYSTRAKRPRKATHMRAESSTSDGTGSATRTTPVNGHVEEFWVPTKTT